ncbi:glycosyltransferase [Robbsia sp. Bb-Pol-6]|uniref:Glycosyltransferase n=1 Tax=Robbsia betulipollinis TaxID=2981849 RepID=A0ABT3ZK11_9BURK|nr:capsular polysaccharide synthesis protein [Robbsia betulipollinis]MCY0386876.1 glycosyltransferase [Robbsia betulipollinis]
MTSMGSGTGIDGTSNTRANDCAEKSRDAFAEPRGDTPRFLTWHGAAAGVGRHAPIPKRIWTYWDSERLPRTVGACIQSWKSKNPDYAINVVTSASLKNFVCDIPPGFCTESVQKQSDWVRLALLKRYGGIWLDATTLVFKPLDYLVDIQIKSRSDVVAYFNKTRTSDPFHPMVENWCVAAPPHSTFISDWLAEFEKSIQIGTDAYFSVLQKSYDANGLLQGMHGFSYFTMHVAAQVLMRRRNAYVLSVMPAEFDAFKLAVNFSWNVEKIVTFLTDDSAAKDFDAARVEGNIFKMIGKVWQPLAAKVDAGDYHDRSIIGKLLRELAEDLPD